MGRGKVKKFVDKKDPKTHNYYLVHRSQRDPLIADEDSSQRVLLPFIPPNSKRADDHGAAAAAIALNGEPEERPVPREKPSAEILKFERRAKNAEHGILFEDDYDYTQHLRIAGQEGSELVLADNVEVEKNCSGKNRKGFGIAGISAAIFERECGGNAEPRRAGDGPAAGLGPRRDCGP